MKKIVNVNLTIQTSIVVDTEETDLLKISNDMVNYIGDNMLEDKLLEYGELYMMGAETSDESFESLKESRKQSLIRLENGQLQFPSK